MVVYNFFIPPTKKTLYLLAGREGHHWFGPGLRVAIRAGEGVLIQFQAQI